MRTEKEIREVYEEEKEMLDKEMYLGEGNDYYIQKGWVEALEYVLKGEK